MNNPKKVEKIKAKNRELWKFTATREFKRAVAFSYPKEWTKYIVMRNKIRVTDLYKKECASEKEKKENIKALENYNEFEL